MAYALAKWASFALAAALIAAPGNAVLGAEAVGDPGPTDIELPAIFAPMVVDNRLESYAYIVIALTPASRDQVFAIREKVPFLRDGFLREVNKSSIVKADDHKAVDAAALKARLMARMNQILPKGMVADLKFEQIVLMPIHPQS